MSFIDLPEARLFYIDVPPLAGASHTGALSMPTVLIHGMWDSADTWIHQLPHIRARCRALAVDLRGHGRTGPSDSEYSTIRHASDIEAFIERLVPGPVVLIGHSMGASVATVLAARRPDLVHALVSIDPDYAGTDSNRARMRALADELDGPSAEATALKIVSDLTAGPDTPAHLVEWHRLAAMWLSPENRARIFRHNAFHPGSIRFRPEADAWLRRRPQPMLALHRDPARMRADQRSFAHPDSRAVAISGTGHFFHQEIPGYVNSEIDCWLATLSS
ncbi:alpha/beta hydrolase [Streptomyces sp. NBC_01102]|uniref:alpha/beta fold hydrolase n=1 Tax=unclassified Streptomyces TaxID=2593676 RepID=UPI003865F4AD|nr:alpha/beta hydrolase [Streptomyces sp. NBC_01102]